MACYRRDASLVCWPQHMWPFSAMVCILPNTEDKGILPTPPHWTPVPRSPPPPLPWLADVPGQRNGVFLLFAKRCLCFNFEMQIVENAPWWYTPHQEQVLSRVGIARTPSPWPLPPPLPSGAFSGRGGEGGWTFSWFHPRRLLDPKMRVSISKPSGLKFSS